MYAGLREGESIIPQIDKLVKSQFSPGFRAAEHFERLNRDAIVCTFMCRHREKQTPTRMIIALQGFLPHGLPCNLHAERGSSVCKIIPVENDENFAAAIMARAPKAAGNSHW